MRLWTYMEGNNMTIAPFRWLVYHHNFNSDKIEHYDVLKYRAEHIKKLKKKAKTKEEFSELLNKEFMWQYWSRSEYELVLNLEDPYRIKLEPWVGSRSPEAATIDVTNDPDFDWIGFVEFIEQSHAKHNNRIKIDIYDQLNFRWESFVEYCWTYKYKYERKRKDV